MDNLIVLAEKEVEQHKNLVESDIYRLKYHLMPPVGLLNDPNGFIQWRGKYYLFYQWNPFKTGHGAKFWGLYTSTNLVDWQDQGIALAPTDWFDKNGCYSGSAVEDENGVLTLFYTGNVKDEQNNRSSYQCKAISTDGITFTKQGVAVELPKGYTPHFRDPKVWKHENTWYMIIGAQAEDQTGKAVLFKSDDLNEWQHLGIIAGDHVGNLGDFGYMWECPDLFELQGKDVLIVSPQGLEPEGILYHNKYQSGYFIGQLNYEQVTFEHGEFVELDRGFEFYAPQTTVDEKGRRLMVGWMGVPEQGEDQQPTVEHKWVHTLTLPRELKFVNEKLYQVPVDELQLLRKEEVHHQSVFIENEEKQLEGVSGDVLELYAQIKELEGQFEITIRDYARIHFDKEAKLFTLERPSFENGEREVRQCVIDQLDELTIYLDTSSIEIFINNGQEVFSSRIFPSKENKQIVFNSPDKALFDVKKWNLN
ncbi:sucrose-6-phosphate hydrolase [Bacillus sp. 03113]|uniref:glycoside hydrolase family 32 protein n=1 Tax=Bacillus sp. 03113 TaxID=2578211 RepID=UPI0011450D92|nr:sucrose-6-phosphate hydrolase [Bacillus sp. 03113]